MELPGTEVVRRPAVISWCGGWLYGGFGDLRRRGKKRRGKGREKMKREEGNLVWAVLLRVVPRAGWLYRARVGVPRAVRRDFLPISLTQTAVRIVPRAVWNSLQFIQN